MVLEGSPEVLAGDIRLWVADPVLGEGCGSGSGGPTLRPSPHPQPPRGAVPSHSRQSAAQQGSGFLSHPQGPPDPPRLPPGPWTPRNSRRLSDALQCLWASPPLCCLLCESFPPSLGRGLLPQSRWQGLAPLGQDFGGVVCAASLPQPASCRPPSLTAEGLLPHRLAMHPPSAQVSPPRGPGSSGLRPLHGGTHAWPVSRPRASSPQPPRWVWVSTDGTVLAQPGLLGRLVTSRSSLLPSGPASSWKRLSLSLPFVAVQSLSRV